MKIQCQRFLYLPVHPTLQLIVSDSWDANITAAGYLIDRAYTIHGSFGYEIPFYDLLVAKDALVGLQNYGGHDDCEGYYCVGFASLPLKFLLRHIEVAEGKQKGKALFY